MIEIDGTFGEGGGQVLRTSLSLAALTGKSFVLDRIRGKRRKPGLQRQHLTCVQAAAAVCGARVQGATLNSTRIEFHPGPRPLAGSYRWEIGSAGSTTLVMQTVLPVLGHGDRESAVKVRGGTHNPLAPSLDFISHSFLPVLEGMGFSATVTLARYGFFPKGGGAIEARIAPRRPAAPLSLVSRSPLSRLRAVVLTSGLPAHITEREKNTLAAQGWIPAEAIECRDLGPGPSGNVVTVIAEYGELALVFTAFGEQGKRAEAVALEAHEEAMRHHRSGAPVEPHLADQLLLYLALAGAGRLTASSISLHATTNMEIIGRFLPVHFTTTRVPDGFLLEVRRVATGEGRAAFLSGGCG